MREKELDDAQAEFRANLPNRLASFREELSRKHEKLSHTAVLDCKIDNSPAPKHLGGDVGSHVMIGTCCAQARD